MRVVRLTDTQAKAMAILSGSRTGTIVGAAGTGKTLIAVERATQLARSGHSVVFALGAGPMLEKRLNAAFDMRRVGVEVLRGQAAVARLDSDEPVDAVIFDEFQQFSLRQLRLLRMAMRHIPLVYIFGDPDQTGRRNLQRLYYEMSTLELYRGGRDFIQLTDNCRNSAPVAQIASAFATFKQVTTEIPGPLPLICGAESRATRASLVANIVDHLRREGIPLSEVAILAMDTAELPAIRKVLQNMGLAPQDLMACCQFREFLGLETTAVVIVDPQATTARFPRVLVTSGRLGRYAATTRARVMLAYVTRPTVADYLTQSSRVISSVNLGEWRQSTDM